jgi:hypothetical protein
MCGKATTTGFQIKELEGNKGFVLRIEAVKFLHENSCMHFVSSTLQHFLLLWARVFFA